MHAGAGLLVLIYNAILKSGFPAEEGSPFVLEAGKIYLLAGISLAGWLRHSSVRKRILPYLASPSNARLEKLQWFPLQQAFNSLLVWLLAIPVLAYVATQVNGAVHPIRFPHFCLSIVFAGLLTSVYSTIFHTALVSALCRSQAKQLRGLVFTARATPWAAILIPLLICFVYVGFEKPQGMDMAAYSKLGRFFSFLILLSGYGWIFCSLTSRSFREVMD